MRHFCFLLIQFIFEALDILFQGHYNSLSIIKKKFQSHKSTLRILGNGSSLNNTTLSENEEVDYLVVNRHVLSDSYTIIKPAIYVLSDPFFFTKKEGLHILENINDSTDWNLCLWIPNKRLYKKVVSSIITNSNIQCIYYNSCAFDNFGNLSYYMYDKQLAMPKVQNVLVAAIMAGVISKYKHIELYGVEHNWLKYLFVGTDNRVYLKDSHFYDEKEVHANAMKRIDGSYYNLHSIMKDYAAMFESYFMIKDYIEVKHPDISIINKTVNSYIDAFPKL